MRKVLKEYAVLGVLLCFTSIYGEKETYLRIKNEYYKLSKINLDDIKIKYLETKDEKEFEEVNILDFSKDRITITNEKGGIFAIKFENCYKNFRKRFLVYEESTQKKVVVSKTKRIVEDVDKIALEKANARSSIISAGKNLVTLYKKKEREQKRSKPKDSVLRNISIEMDKNKDIIRKHNAYFRDLSYGRYQIKFSDGEKYELN